MVFTTNLMNEQKSSKPPKKLEPAIQRKNHTNKAKQSKNILTAKKENCLDASLELLRNPDFGQNLLSLLKGNSSQAPKMLPGRPKKTKRLPAVNGLNKAALVSNAAVKDLTAPAKLTRKSKKPSNPTPANRDQKQGRSSTSNIVATFVSSQPTVNLNSIQSYSYLDMISKRNSRHVHETMSCWNATCNVSSNKELPQPNFSSSSTGSPSPINDVSYRNSPHNSSLSNNHSKAHEPIESLSSHSSSGSTPPSLTHSFPERFAAPLFTRSPEPSRVPLPCSFQDARQRAAAGRPLSMMCLGKVDEHNNNHPAKSKISTI